MWRGTNTVTFCPSYSNLGKRKSEYTGRENEDMRWKTRKVRGNLRFGEAPRKRLNLDWVPDALKWLFQIAIVCFIAFVAVWYFGHRISCL